MISDRSRKYIAALTGLRGIAAFLVFLFHYEALHPGIRLDLWVPLIGSALQFPLGYGMMGVDLFFVLSGFLLTLPFARSALTGEPRPPLLRYFKRRFLRVFPAYYAQLFIILLLAAWFVTWRPMPAYALFAHLVMFLNLGWHQVRPLVGVWWSLPVEMGFYLLLPLLAPFLKPVRWVPVLLGGIVLSVLYRSWAAAKFGPLSSAASFLAASQLPGMLSEFLLGATAALLVQLTSVKGWRRPKNWILDMMFVGGVTLAVLWMSHVIPLAGADYWLGHWGMLLAPLALGFSLSMVVLGLYWGSRIGNFLLANRVVYFLGLISYSFYLWHFVVMQQIQQFMDEAYHGLTHWIKFPLAATAVLLVASLSYYLIERPFYRLASYAQTRSS